MCSARQISGEPAELDALFAQAVGQQRAGRLAEAAAGFRQILTLRPELPVVQNYLGIVFCQQGQFDEGLARFERAIALEPRFADAYNNLGNVLRQLGKLDEAAVRYLTAIELKPDYPEAHHNLGSVLLEQGQLERAAEQFERAIALQPDHADAHYNLGNIFLQQNKLDQAAACYNRALAFRPGLLEAHINLGNVLWQQGRLDEAAARYRQALALDSKCAEAECHLASVLAKQDKFEEAAAGYQRAIELKPDYPEAHNGLGFVRASRGQFDAAAASYERAIALRPNYAEAYNNLGNVFWEQSNLPEAAAHFVQALHLSPNYFAAQNNLGKVFRGQGKLDEAVTCLEQAVALRPDDVAAHTQLANTLVSQDRIDEAAARYEQALALKPDSAEAQMGRAVCSLLDGDYQRGWPAFEARLVLPGAAPPPELPRWNREPLAGRTLLLLGECGYGDTLQFVRYAKWFKAQGARVVLAAQRALCPLLASGPDWDQLCELGSGEPLPFCDFYIPLMSAPLALLPCTAAIPREVPYLAADPDLTERWRRELAGIDGFRIGIVWQGSRQYAFDRRRSLPLAQFAPLARLPGVRLISLQKGFGSEQIATVDFPVIDFSDRLDEAAGRFMDTAAVIANLDLVVTIDTSIGHLAGALGAPVWLALPIPADWRWQRGRDDSPWYPTVRLFRQTTLGHWPDVFERIAQAVAQRRSETARVEGET